MKTLIPKDFLPVAYSDVGNNNVAIAYYNKKRQMMIFKVNGKLLDAISVSDLGALYHVFQDIMQMKGRFVPISIPNDKEI